MLLPIKNKNTNIESLLFGLNKNLGVKKEIRIDLYWLFSCFVKSVVRAIARLFTNDHNGESGHNPGHRIDTIDGNLITTRNRRCTKRSRVSFYIDIDIISFCFWKFNHIYIVIISNQILLSFYHTEKCSLVDCLGKPHQVRIMYI